MLQLQSQSHVYIQGGSLSVSLARSEFEIEEAQRLRYKVFAEEMGANIVSDNGLDTDRYDEHCQHLLVRERENDRIIGCYRLLTAESAAAVGGWYSANEFDLSRLQHILPQAVELGRACVHPRLPLRQHHYLIVGRLDAIYAAARFGIHGRLRQHVHERRWSHCREHF